MMLKYIFVQDVVEQKQTTLAYDNTNAKGMRNVGSEAQQRLRKTRSKQSQWCEIWTDVSRSQGRVRRATHSNFAVSSEFALGDNKLSL